MQQCKQIQKFARMLMQSKKQLFAIAFQAQALHADLEQNRKVLQLLYFHEANLLSHWQAHD